MTAYFSYKVSINSITKYILLLFFFLKKKFIKMHDAFLLQLHFYKLRAYKNMKLGGFHHLGDIPMKIHIKIALSTKAK